MKIGFFTTDFPYKKPFNENNSASGSFVWGGVGEVAYQLAGELSRMGHEISVFTTSADNNDTTEQVETITLKRYGKSFRIAETDISLKYLFHTAKCDLDLIHLHAGSPPATIAAMKYHKRHKVPFVITDHLDPEYIAGSPLRNILLYLYSKFILERAFSECDRIIALSEEFVYSSQYLQKHTSKIKIIPNGINSREFEINKSKEQCRRELDLPNDVHMILFFGNIIPRKGPHIILKAMPKILEEHKDILMVFTGSMTPFGEALKKEADELGFSDHVIFTDRVNENHKKLYYCAADIFAFPSFSESFGLVMREAACCGLPLVVSDLPVFDSFMENGFNGYRCETGNSDAFSSAIIDLIQNPKKRIEMGNNARMNSQKFEWEAIASETENLYRELL